MTFCHNEQGSLICRVEFLDVRCPYCSPLFVCSSPPPRSCKGSVTPRFPATFLCCSTQSMKYWLQGLRVALLRQWFSLVPAAGRRPLNCSPIPSSSPDVLFYSSNDASVAARRKSLYFIQQHTFIDNAACRSSTRLRWYNLIRPRGGYRTFLPP